jgi:hypothetical protein
VVCFGVEHEDAVDAQEQVEKLEEAQRESLLSGEEQITYFKEKLKCAQKDEDLEEQAVAHYSLSRAFESSDDLESAIEHMQQAHACYVECFDAEHEDAEDAQEQVERLQRGPCQCELESFQTDHADFGCDGCHTSISQGVTMHGCRTCDFDLCESCFADRLQPTSPKRRGFWKWRR